MPFFSIVCWLLQDSEIISGQRFVFFACLADPVIITTNAMKPRLAMLVLQKVRVKVLCLFADRAGLFVRQLALLAHERFFLLIEVQRLGTSV
jgi:hypothetical protein